MNESVEDMLYVSVDFSPNDTDMMMVMRGKGDKTHIINFLKNEEARKLYSKLIGKPYSICNKCQYSDCAWRSDYTEECEYFKH